MCEQADLRGLRGVFVPEALPELTTRRVLVTEWVAGEKLSESRAGDVRELCTTLLNAYLIQLLDTGRLHADPHPGNLIRTPDGRIAILDYGAPPPPHLLNAVPVPQPPPPPFRWRCSEPARGGLRVLSALAFNVGLAQWSLGCRRRRLAAVRRRRDAGAAKFVSFLVH